ncbi:MAG: peptidase C45 [Acidobacteriaceae bacterium]|nr:peptidase C45 [Acidobacteriaceae bacterium]MBV9781880.1 peptidase C45 [Acidobacteriaceae bacterium]
METQTRKPSRCAVIEYMIGSLGLRRFALLIACCGVFAAYGGTRAQESNDPRLHGGFRNPTKEGWIFVHLEGGPSAVGFQHGYLLSSEIEDDKRAIELSTTHGVNHSWNEMRSVAQKYFWPRVPDEYRQELLGMADGLRAHGSKLDVMDLVTMNAFMEYSYYYGEARRQQAKRVIANPAEHCSAFVATGSYTKDGRIVIGHNNWTDYLTGSRWDMIFDIAPAGGHHFIMDGMPGLIHSGDDFGINDAGIMITETTIGNFHGFDKKAIPEFVRARKAMQYSESIDDFNRIMREGNNGGYANTWLVGDRKTNEIARLELGLKNVTLERTKDGYFVGSNFPINPKLIAEETDFPANDPNTPNQVRHRRWDALMAEYKGRIDVEAGEKFETDHYDMITKEVDPNERTICGHIDKSSRGLKGWQGPYGPAGTAEAKVADSVMAEKLSFVAGMGHPCGVEFHATEFLKAHKEYAWQKPLLEDLKANRWTVFAAARGTETTAAVR